MNVWSDSDTTENSMNDEWKKKIIQTLDVGHQFGQLLPE